MVKDMIILVNEVYESKEGKGRVIEYYDDGVVKFIGQYEFGERNGEGIKLDHNDFIVYIGTYKNGEKLTGKEIEYYFSPENFIDLTPSLISLNNPVPEEKNQMIGYIKVQKKLIIL